MAKALLKKITVKSVCGDLQQLALKTENDKPVLNEGDYMLVATFIGAANKQQQKTTDLGDSIEFTGRFEGINAIDGTSSVAAKCYLPEVAADAVSSAMLANEGSTVEFAFEIGIIRDSSAVRGYKFQVTPLIDEPQENDPLAALRNKVSGKAIENKPDLKAVEPEKKSEQKPQQNQQGKQANKK